MVCFHGNSHTCLASWSWLLPGISAGLWLGVWSLSLLACSRAA